LEMVTDLSRFEQGGLCRNNIEMAIQVEITLFSAVVGGIQDLVAGDSLNLDEQSLRFTIGGRKVNAPVDFCLIARNGGNAGESLDEFYGFHGEILSSNEGL